MFDFSECNLLSLSKGYEMIKWLNHLNVKRWEDVNKMSRRLNYYIKISNSRFPITCKSLSENL